MTNKFIEWIHSNIVMIFVAFINAFLFLIIASIIKNSIAIIITSIIFLVINIITVFILLYKKFDCILWQWIPHVSWVYVSFLISLAFLEEFISIFSFFHSNDLLISCLFFQYIFSIIYCGLCFFKIRNTIGKKYIFGGILTVFFVICASNLMQYLGKEHFIKYVMFLLSLFLLFISRDNWIFFSLKPQYIKRNRSRNGISSIAPILGLVSIASSFISLRTLQIAKLKYPSFFPITNGILYKFEGTGNLMFLGAKILICTGTLAIIWKVTATIINIFKDRQIKNGYK